MYQRIGFDVRLQRYKPAQSRESDPATMLSLVALENLSNNHIFQHSIKSIEKRLPCGDISHYQPLFFPTTCHHPHKVLVADLEEGIGTLVHAGSKRNPSFGLWPLGRELVEVAKKELEMKDMNTTEVDGERSEQESFVQIVGPDLESEDIAATSLEEFLGVNKDSEWEIVNSAPIAKEKFVLVGKPGGIATKTQ